jgi:protein arginine N-methyltransferase 1
VENRCHDKVVLVDMDAHAFVPPEPIDVVICEMTNSGLVHEPMVSVLNSFKDKAGACYTTIPQSVKSFIELAYTDFEYNGYHASFPHFRPLDGQFGTFIQILSKRELYWLADFSRKVLDVVDITISITPIESGSVNSVRISSDLHLSPAHVLVPTLLSTFPPVIIPLDSPVHVKKGEDVKLTMKYQAGCYLGDVFIQLKN